MKKFAADNLLFLRSHYPEIYNLVRNKTFDKNRIATDLAKNGQPILSIRDGERETAMYSRYNPALEADRWAASISMDKDKSDNILMFGFGLGYHAEALLQAFPDRKMYIYEPDLDVFLAAVEHVDLRSVLAREQIALFAVGGDATVHDAMLREIFRMSNGSFSFQAPPVYRKQYAGLIEAFSEQARRTALSYSIDRNTIRHFRREWIENIMINAARNLRTRSFRGLKNSCAGIPAVIAGSGPSLGMQMENLKAIRDRILLIAAGSSIQSLLHHGVEPDLIVSMDAGEPNRRVFEQLDVSNIPFLYISMIKHTAIRDDQSPYLLHAYFNVDSLSDAILELGEEDVVLSTSSTVTGTSIQAAIWLGCTDIVLIGQDFSFPGEQVYAAGIQHLTAQNQKQRYEQSDLTVPNVNGGENRTNRSMLNLKRDTEAVMATLSQIRFYNASPVGAVIEHTKPLLLDELPIRLSAEQRPADWFKQVVLEQAAPLSAARKMRVKQRVNQIRKSGDQFSMDMQEVNGLIQRSVSLLSGTPNAGKIRNWMETFETVWPRIVDSQMFKQVYQFFLTPEYTHANRHWPDMRAEQDPARKLERLLHCISPLVAAINELMPVFESGLDGLESALVKEQ